MKNPILLLLLSVLLLAVPSGHAQSRPPEWVLSSTNVYIHQNKSVWNYPIRGWKHEPDDVAETIKKYRSFVFFYHTEWFDYEYVSAHAKIAYEAFGRLSKKHPDIAFILIIDEYPPTQRPDFYTEHFEVLDATEKELPETIKTKVLPLASSCGVKISDTKPEFPSVFCIKIYSQKGFKLLEDFSSNNSAPLFFITDRKGRITHLIRTDSLGGLKELEEYLGSGTATKTPPKPDQP